MMIKRLLIIAVLAFLGFVTGNTQTKAIIGAYQSCEMACQTIQIRSDHTFERVLDGDLFNDERTIGKWVYLGRNRIKATGPKPGGPPKVEENSGSGDSFQVVVTDFVRAVLPQVEIAGKAEGKPFCCVTNDDGFCEIPKSESFTVTRQHYSATYTVRNPLSRVFYVELSNDQMPNGVIDDVWVIKQGALFWERDGKVDKDYSLRKIGKKKEMNLFPRS